MPFMGSAVGGALTLRTAITLANKQFLAAMEQVDRKTGAIARGMQRHSKRFAIGALVIGAALAGTVRAAAAFEQSMANMDSVARTTRAEFAQLEAQALSLGTTTVYNATQVADAMYWLASAGQRAAEISSTLPGVLMLATATGHDLADTTETVVSVLSAFQYEAALTDRVVNSMAATIGSSLANMHKMTEALKYAAPVAKAAGQEIEDLNAMLGLFFNAGLAGSQAGTSYRRVILGLLKPNTDFVKILSAMDMTIADVNPKMNDMADIVDTLRDRFFNATDVVESFGLRGATSMLYLMEVGGDALREMKENVTGTTAAQDMMRRQMDTLQSQLTILKNAFHGAAIKLGSALLPALRKGAAWVMRLAAALASMSKPMAMATAKSMAMGGALLGVLSIVGRMAPLLGAAAGPIGLIAAAVVGLGIAHTIAKGKLASYIEELEGATEAEAENLQSKIKWSLVWATVTNWKMWTRALAAGTNATAAATAVMKTLTEELLDAMGLTSDAATTIVDGMAAQIKAANEQAARETKAMMDKLQLAERLVQESEGLRTAAEERAKAREKAVEQRRKLMWVRFKQQEEKGATATSDAFRKVYEELERRLAAGGAISIAEAKWLQLGRAADWAGEKYKGFAGTTEEVAERHRAAMQQIKEEAEWVTAGLMNAMNQMGAAMTAAVEEGGSLFAAMGKAALSAFADMFEALLSTAIAEIVLEQFKTAGILTIKGFLNPANWLKILPAMAAGAAAIAAVKTVRSKLKFHEGGKPPGEGYYKILSDEHVFNPHKARRGGYGSTYRDTFGALESIEIHLHDVRIERDGRPVGEIAIDLADQLRGELARGGI